MGMQEHYPCMLDCYLMVARDGKPPHPEDEPKQCVLVTSKEDADRAKQEFQEQYPNSWCVERPLDRH